jgi:hypothetical protein
MEMFFKAVIEYVWRYALGGYESANLQAVIKQVGRCTRRL